MMLIITCITVCVLFFSDCLMCCFQIILRSSRDDFHIVLWTLLAIWPGVTTWTFQMHERVRRARDRRGKKEKENAERGSMELSILLREFNSGLWIIWRYWYWLVFFEIRIRFTLDNERVFQLIKLLLCVTLQVSKSTHTQTPKHVLDYKSTRNRGTPPPFIYTKPLDAQIMRAYICMSLAR